jgi:hypothetical protein
MDVTRHRVRTVICLVAAKPQRKSKMSKMNAIAQEKNEVAITTDAMTEATNILAAVKEDASFKLLKFRKGDYFIKDDLAPIDVHYLMHVTAWTKEWIKFLDKKKVAHKPYRVSRGEIPPEREELDELDKIGSKDSDGKSNDPWTFQYLVPFENLSSGEILIFTTPSYGGREAVLEVAEIYGKRIIKGQHGQPIVKLASVDMPTKHGGTVRPKFEIVGWDETGTPPPEKALATAIPISEKTVASDLDDEIPF